MPAAERDRIMHARLEVGGDALMATDSTSAYPPLDPLRLRRVRRSAYAGRRPSASSRYRRRERGDADAGDVLGESLRHHRRPLGVPWMINCAKSRSMAVEQGFIVLACAGARRYLIGRHDGDRHPQTIE